jgi:hypothetical protein
MQISVKNLSFPAGVGHHFEIGKNIGDSILKNFGQVVDYLKKGFACGLHY